MEMNFDKQGNTAVSPINAGQIPEVDTPVEPIVVVNTTANQATTTTNQSNPEVAATTNPIAEQAAQTELSQLQAIAAPPAAKKEPPRVVVGQTSQPRGVGYADVPTVPITSISTGPVQNPNVHLEYPYGTKEELLTAKTEFKAELLPLLAERGEDIDERIRAYVSPRTLQTGPGMDWNNALIGAASTSAYHDNRFITTVRAPGTKWMQYLETEHGKIGYKAPQPKEAGVGKFTGERALHRVRSILGISGQITVPMYHSGFWITLDAPRDSDVIELHRRVMEEKIKLGRETYGLVFSNEQSYINSFLLDFCISHISSHTVRVDNDNDLKALIKPQDMNILFWGIACLIWPRGFDYVRSLLTTEGIENTQIVTAKISLGKLMWVDNASFTDRQRNHFAQKQRHQMTIESIKEYQREFMPSLAGGRLIDIKEGLQLLISPTSAEEMIADGAAWISGIVQTVDSTFTQVAPDERTRNGLIEMHARAAKLRNYGAWVKAIVIDGQENEDRQDINEILTLVSTETDMTDNVIKEIGKFIDDSTRALIAIPESSGANTALPLFPNLIPLDVLNTFFTLLAQRVDIIANR